MILSGISARYDPEIVGFNLISAGTWFADLRVMRGLCALLFVGLFFLNACGSFALTQTPRNNNQSNSPSSPGPLVDGGNSEPGGDLCDFPGVDTNANGIPDCEEFYFRMTGVIESSPTSRRLLVRITSGPSPYEIVGFQAMMAFDRSRLQFVSMSAPAESPLQSALGPSVDPVAGTLALGFVQPTLDGQGYVATTPIADMVFDVSADVVLPSATPLIWFQPLGSINTIGMYYSNTNPVSLAPILFNLE